MLLVPCGSVMNRDVYWSAWAKDWFNVLGRETLFGTRLLLPSIVQVNGTGSAHVPEHDDDHRQRTVSSRTPA